MPRAFLAAFRAQSTLSARSTFATVVGASSDRDRPDQMEGAEGRKAMNRSLDRSRLPRLRHRILLAGLLSIGLVAAAPTKGSAFSGVVNNLEVSALTGWTQCYLDKYNNTGLTTAGVLADCT